MILGACCKPSRSELIMSGFIRKTNKLTGTEHVKRFVLLPFTCNCLIAISFENMNSDSYSQNNIEYLAHLINKSNDPNWQFQLLYVNVMLWAQKH